MVKVIDSRNMGTSEKGWLHSLFHFSFAEYYNPANLQFGALRVLNDDIVEPGTGFDTHPHRDMEIISYVVEGALTHADSMGNQRTLTRGQVQYMSAGTGVLHSEHNLTDGPLRFLQIWILPDKKGYAPNYGDVPFTFAERENQWLHIASGQAGAAPIHIHQDVEVSALHLAAGREMEYKLKSGRQAYLVQIEGTGSVNGQPLARRDAAEISGESQITLKANEDAHYILLDISSNCQFA